MPPTFVIPANAGTQREKNWVPAFAGMTMVLLCLLTAGCHRADSSVQAKSLLDVGLMRVQDRAGILSGADEIEITRLSEALEKTTSDQFVVVTVPSLNRQQIERFSTTLANRMGVGRADIDNGVLLVVAPQEKKVRIEVGYGLEGLLTDERAAGIVQDMLPKFRTGDMAGGVRTGTSEIQQLLLSDRKRPRYLNEARRRAAA